ncbi:MAG: valine--tRNA ligase [Thermoleophilaceae bacterium]
MPDDRLKDLQERTRYLPAEVESRVFERWERAGVFSPESEGSAEQNFSIAVPPPNVTGALHMGHALNGTYQDLFIRRARMQGRRAKWIFGTDHAGIATQVKVEQALAQEGKTKEDLGREAFAERVWEWRRQYGDVIKGQFQKLGASLDYADERFTMDEPYARAVVEVFTALYEKGLVYRDNFMVNWDPGTRSAISDLEVEQRRTDDTLYMVDYPLESGSGSVTVATVRPETMLADTAIAVNPDDERYTRLIGERAILPLVGRSLPIIGDPYVKTDFGTGALKITPGHDPNDFEIGRRHGLEEISVIGEDGRMTPAAGERFEGMTVDEAQRAVVAALREEGRLSGTQPYSHDVPYSHRSGERIEPLISLQWFCDMARLAEPAIAAVREGRVRFHPERPHTQVYLDWLGAIRPWCVSRQLWWGHQIPAWYRGQEVYVGAEPPGGEGWERDPDVLDTWFSSGLWPFATLGWPEDSPELRAFYPTDVLTTGRDIIFLWVARMVMLGLEFTGEIPFADVSINSTIMAPDGRRMSKSLGTGIDPLDQIAEYGADAVRFGLVAMASTQDVRFSVDRVRQGRDLANKLWNASRLILLGVGEGAEPSPDHAFEPEQAAPARGDLAPEDRWILSRLERVTERTNDLIDAFDLSTAALELYDFFWSELCDWYLEMAKSRLHEENRAPASDRTAVSATLLFALDRTLRLLHPLMPHVTEEIWSFMPGERELLTVSEWPQARTDRFDEQAEAELGATITAVTLLRRYRDLAGVKPSAVLRARISADGLRDTAAQVARLARLELSEDGGRAVAEVAVPGGVVELLEGGDFDPGEAGRRIAAQRDKLLEEVERLEKKLANERFVQRAPAEVVEGERAKLTDYRRSLERLAQ